MAMLRLTMMGNDGKRTTRYWYPETESNTAWGFTAKMAFLVPAIYASVTLETVDDKTYTAWQRERNDRASAADRARVAWEEFMKGEAELRLDIDPNSPLGRLP